MAAEPLTSAFVAPEPEALVVSTACTHVAQGLPDLIGDVPTRIPVSLLPLALALPGVKQLHPDPNPDMEA